MLTKEQCCSEGEEPTGGPCGEDRPKEEECIVKRTDLASLSRVGKLGDENRRGLRDERSRGTKEPTGDDEHGQADTGALQGGAQKEEEKPNPHGCLSTIFVRQPCNRNQTHDLADGVHSVHRAEDRCAWMTKVAAPLLNRLQPVHHGTVEAHRGRRKHRNQKSQVEQKQVLGTVPWCRVFGQDLELMLEFVMAES